MVPQRSWFVIRVDGRPWPSFSWYILRRTPFPLQNGSGIIQESDRGWCTQSYRENLMKSHPKFLPELTRSILPGFYKCGWKDEKKSIIQSTLATCCLVSREWNRVFTPILYQDILLGGKKSLVTRSLLYRTFRQGRPGHKALVKTVMIAPAEDGSTANLLSICFSLPNLQKLTLKFHRFDLSTLNPNFVQQLRFLSTRCTIEMGEYAHQVEIGGWGSLSSYVNFTRRSELTPPTFKVHESGGR